MRKLLNAKIPMLPAICAVIFLGATTKAAIEESATTHGGRTRTSTKAKMKATTIDVFFEHDGVIIAAFAFLCSLLLLPLRRR